MTTATMRDFRAKMKGYFDSIEENKDILLVPRQGDKEAIVIMTLSEYNSIVETEYILSTEANRKVINRALSELGSGEVTELSLEG